MIFNDNKFLTNRVCHRLFLSAFGLMLSACASLPDIEVSYYLPKVTSQVVVTQTATCHTENSQGRQRPLVLTDVSLLHSYSADRREERLFTLKTRELSSPFSATSASINLSDDGRLLGLGIQSSSQFNDLVNVVLSSVDFVSMAAAGTQSPEQIAAQIEKACAYIDRQGTDGLLSLTRRGDVIYALPGDFSGTPPQPRSHNKHVNEQPASQATFGIDKIEQDYPTFMDSVFGEIQGSAITYTIAESQKSPIATTGTSSPGITLVEPAKGGIFIDVIFSDRTESYHVSTWVPQNGHLYQLPLQAPTIFGNHSTQFSLAENGRITQLNYSANPETAGVSVFIDQLKSLSETFQSTNSQMDSTQIEIKQRNQLKCMAGKTMCK